MHILCVVIVQIKDCYVCPKNNTYSWSLFAITLSSKFQFILFEKCCEFYYLYNKSAYFDADAYVLYDAIVFQVQLWLYLSRRGYKNLISLMSCLSIVLGNVAY